MLFYRAHHHPEVVRTKVFASGEPLVKDEEEPNSRKRKHGEDNEMNTKINGAIDAMLLGQAATSTREEERLKIERDWNAREEADEYRKVKALKESLIAGKWEQYEWFVHSTNPNLLKRAEQLLEQIERLERV